MYISEKTGMKIERPSYDDIKKILKQENIQLGPNQLVLHICFTLGSQTKDKQPETAVFFYSILNDLLDVEDIKKTLDELQERVKG
jgi:ribosomal protein S2